MSSAGELRPCSGHIQSSLVGVTVDNNQREIYDTTISQNLNYFMLFLKKKKLFMMF